MLRQVATYIGVESPEKRCGKTTLLTVLCELVNRPVVASNISSPAFFRVIEEKKPTLLIDEADTVLHRNKELKGILNAGCARKTGYVIRPRTVWIGETSAKGYMEEDLKEAFRRYIPKSAVQALIDESRAAEREKPPAGPTAAPTTSEAGNPSRDLRVLQRGSERVKSLAKRRQSGPAASS